MTAIGPFLSRPRIAYFFDEDRLRPEVHTYSGGLAVDTSRSAADSDVPWCS